jgi:hypothetical protein
MSDREAAYARYLDLSEPYFAKVEAEGDTPWWSSEDERRALFMKRFTRPTPPAGLTIPDIKEHQ